MSEQGFEWIRMSAGCEGRAGRGGAVELLAAAALSITLAGSAFAGLPCGYEIVADLKIAPCEFGPQILGPSAINNRGEVVGSYAVCTIGQSKPFYWSEETGVVLPALPEGVHEVVFIDISDDGEIVGTWYDDFGDVSGIEGFRIDESGQWIGLGTLPGGNYSIVAGVNSDGTIVGRWGNSVTGVSFGLSACRWENSTLIDIGGLLGNPPESRAMAVNDDGLIGGSFGTNFFTEMTPFFLHDGELTIVPKPKGYSYAEVTTINSAGDAIIQARKTGSLNLHSFLWSDGIMTPILPDHEPLIADGLSASGVICASDNLDEYVTDLTSTAKLADLILGPDRYHSIFAISNDAGWLVANSYKLPNGPVSQLVLRPVPGPADLNGDCKVDGADLGLLLSEWGVKPSAADLTYDGMVDGADLGVLLSSWTGP